MYRMLLVVSLFVFSLIHNSAVAFAQQGPPYVWTTPTVGYFTQNNLDIRANVFKIEIVNGMPQEKFQGTLNLCAKFLLRAVSAISKLCVVRIQRDQNWNSGTYVVRVQQYTPPNNIQVLQNFHVFFP